MWHRITLTRDEVGDSEEFRILDAIDEAVLEIRRSCLEAIKVRRARDRRELVPLTETPVEIDSYWEGDRCILHLNDAALALYRGRGGARQVEARLGELPHGQPASLMRQIMFTVAYPV